MSNVIHSLNGLGIGFRIFLVFVLPVVALLWFSGAAVHGQFSIAREMEALRSLVSVGAKFSLVIHELQKERGISAGYLASSGQKFGPRVDAQRVLTDEKLAVLRTTLHSPDFSAHGDALLDAVARADGFLDALSAKRKQITALELKGDESFAYYTETLDHLILVIARMAVMSKNPSIARAINAFVAFIESKEFTGQERATGNFGLTEGKFVPAIYQRFVRLIATQDAYLHQFATFASPELLAFSRETVSGQPVDEVARMREAILKSPEMGHLGGLEPLRWFDTITEKIDLQKKVEDRIVQEIQNSAGQVADAAWKHFFSITVVVVLLVAAMVTVIVLIVRSITKPLILTSGDVNTGAVSIAESLATQVAISSEMSASMAEITATTEELLASSTQIAEHSGAVLDLANVTWESSKTGAEAMELAISKMNAIQQDTENSLREIIALGVTSKEIGKIMGIITTIADQTKLIAFNAALEAASAGDAGRRFGVVAAEIRHLADNVTDSTKEIEGKVGEIQGSISRLVLTSEKGAHSIQEGLTAIGNTSDRLCEIVDVARQTTDAAQQISQSTRQQTTASNQIVVALREIMTASNHTAQSISSISGISKDMTRISAELDALVGGFRADAGAAAA